MLTGTHMNINEIRAMDYTDFLVHTRLCLARFNVEREFQLNLAGVDTRSTTKTPPPQKTEQVKKGGGTVKRTETLDRLKF
jgi:hypothetical protein